MTGQHTHTHTHTYTYTHTHHIAHRRDVCVCVSRGPNGGRDSGKKKNCLRTVNHVQKDGYLFLLSFAGCNDRGGGTVFFLFFSSFFIFMTTAV